MDRRQFLKMAGIGLLYTGITATLRRDNVSIPFDMSIAKEEGLILADFHNHIGKANENELRKWLSAGMTGIAASNKSHYLTYGDLLNMTGVKELERGLVASVSFQGSKGYMVKAQEVRSDYHILAIGCRDTVKEYSDARYSVEAIHEQGGIAILCHPYLTKNKGMLPYRVIEQGTNPELDELCLLCDEIETFNAHCIDIIPGIMGFRKANHYAEELAMEWGHKGVPGTDSHNLLDIIGTSGIFIADDRLSIDALKETIHKGEFGYLKRYVSMFDVGREWLD